MGIETTRDNAARLKVARLIADLADAEQTFPDAIVASAAALAGTPISAVTIVDQDTVLVKSSRGLRIGEARRVDSFCTHAILSAERLVIEDARQDKRFCDNPFVRGAPFIRFYAGFVVVVAGQPVGALCVIDDRPRSLSVDQMESLQVLAQGTAAWLSLELERTGKGRGL